MKKIPVLVPTVQRLQIAKNIKNKNVPSASTVINLSTMEFVRFVVQKHVVVKTVKFQNGLLARKSRYVWMKLLTNVYQKSATSTTTSIQIPQIATKMSVHAVTVIQLTRVILIRRIFV